jgi:hypothetical protein
MLNCDPPPPADRLSLPLIPLPIALYVSRGLIFELYDGGQPRRTFSIRWEWLVPAERNQSDADPQSPEPCQRKRQD